MFPESAGLERVRAPDLGDRVAGARHVLVGIKTLGFAPDLEASVGADIRRFRGVAGQVRELGDTILEQSLIGIAYIGPVHFRRILKHVGKADERVTKYELISHGGIEYVSQRGGERIGTILALNRAGVRNLLDCRRRPEADGEQLRLALHIVADE